MTSDGGSGAVPGGCLTAFSSPPAADCGSACAHSPRGPGHWCVLGAALGAGATAPWGRAAAKWWEVFSEWLFRGEGEAATGGFPLHPSLPGAPKTSRHEVSTGPPDQQDGASSQRVGVKSHLQLGASELSTPNLVFIT